MAGEDQFHETRVTAQLKGGGDPNQKPLIMVSVAEMIAVALTTLNEILPNLPQDSVEAGKLRFALRAIEQLGFSQSRRDEESGVPDEFTEAIRTLRRQDNWQDVLRRQQAWLEKFGDNTKQSV